MTLPPAAIRASLLRAVHDDPERPRDGNKSLSSSHSTPLFVGRIVAANLRLEIEGNGIAPENLSCFLETKPFLHGNPTGFVSSPRSPRSRMSRIVSQTFSGPLIGVPVACSPLHIRDLNFELLAALQIGGSIAHSTIRRDKDPSFSSNRSLSHLPHQQKALIPRLPLSHP
jgi:hypothetical protein